MSNHIPTTDASEDLGRFVARQDAPVLIGEWTAQTREAVSRLPRLEGPQHAMPPAFDTKTAPEISVDDLDQETDLGPCTVIGCSYPAIHFHATDPTEERLPLPCECPPQGHLPRTDLYTECFTEGRHQLDFCLEEFQKAVQAIHDAAKTASHTATEAADAFAKAARHVCGETVEQHAFDAYQKAARKTAIYPGSGEFPGLAYVSLGLASEAGEIAGKVKKIHRDADGEISEEARLALADELGDVLWYLAQMASELGESLAEIARRNLDKLQDRATRGVLGGSGDTR